MISAFKILLLPATLLQKYCAGSGGMIPSRFQAGLGLLVSTASQISPSPQVIPVRTGTNLGRFQVSGGILRFLQVQCIFCTDQQLPIICRKLRGSQACPKQQSAAFQFLGVIGCLRSCLRCLIKQLQRIGILFPGNSLLGKLQQRQCSKQSLLPVEDRVGTLILLQVLKDPRQPSDRR